MPRTALSYGAIPIISLVGWLNDTFNEENCIPVYNNNVIDAVRYAAELYNDKNKFNQLRDICITEDVSWETHKIPYIEIYEN